MRRFLLATLICSTPALSAHAQTRPSSAGTPAGLVVEPLVSGERLEFPTVRGQPAREVRVWTPPSYEESNDRFPVIYVLDGELLFHVAAGAVRYLAAYGLMPEAIVVGVHSADRVFEMTPSPAGGWTPPMPDGFGGAEHFIQFIVDELTPALDQRYRTSGMRVLAGHSLGGLLTAHTLVHRPTSFSGYLAMDPSLWWNERRLVERVEEVLAGSTGAGIRLVSAEATTGFAGDWAGIASNAHHDAQASFLEIQGETHATMAFEGTFRGLRELFADYPLPELTADDPLRQVADHYENLSERYGYTVSVPASAHRRAVGALVDANRLAEADAALTTLEDLPVDQTLLDELRSTVSSARADQDRFLFVPLVVPDGPPTATEMTPFIGVWRGVVATDPGVDLEITATIHADGPGWVVDAELTGPGGHTFSSRSEVLRVTPGGDLEWSRAGGGGGQVVSILRLDGPDQLVGRDELRGVRVPREGFPTTTLRLQRMEGR